MKLRQHFAAHMTKMSAMPINMVKTLQKSSLMKLCMQHQRPKPYIICANYDLGLTLTYFMARSNFAT